MHKKINLFCIPYAGSSAAVYHNWRNYLDGSIALIPLELKGRGRRFKEPFYNSVEEAVEDIYSMVKDSINEKPYAFFGHSMGSLLLYELAKKIMNSGKHPAPVHLFFSGRKAPHVEYKKIGQLPDPQFIDELIKLGGITDDFLENSEMQSVFLPILRADFKICESYIFDGNMNKFDCDITVYYGKDDEMTFGRIDEWDQYKGKSMRIVCLPGGHFFIFDHMKTLVEDIGTSLLLKIAGGNNG